MRKSLLLLIVIGTLLYFVKWFNADPAIPLPYSQGVTASAVADSGDVLLLVNKSSALAKTYIPGDLTEANVRFSGQILSEERLLRKPAAEALEKLFAAARADGIALVATSGYRSYESQVAVCDDYVRTKGKKAAELYCAEPGKSEHQTGLAMDIGSATATEPLGDKFGSTAEGKWVAKHAAEYGFIIRYPKGKENITGYAYEPWHLRYVGVEAAKAIAQKGIALEEYLASNS